MLEGAIEQADVLQDEYYARLEESKENTSEPEQQSTQNLKELSDSLVEKLKNTMTL